MHQIPHFLEARAFGSPPRSSDCSEFLFSTSKRNYQEDGIFDNGELAMILDPSQFLCLKVENSADLEPENQDFHHNAAQFAGSSNFIETTHSMEEELCKMMTQELFIKQSQDNELMVDGFIDLVGKISSFYINKLQDGKQLEEHPPLQDQIEEFVASSISQSPKDSSLISKCSEEVLELKVNKNPLLRKTIKKMPKKQQRGWTLEDDKKLEVLVKQLDFDWENILKKFKKIANIDKKFLQNRYHAIKAKDKTSKQAFSKEEDLLIVKYHQLYKGNWDQISKFIPNRKAYLIKKRFYSDIRKNLSQLSKELLETERKGCENQEEIFHAEKEYSTDLTTDSRALSEVEEHSSGREDDENSRKQSKIEAIQVLSSRISALQSLYNQTRVELTELQKDCF